MTEFVDRHIGPSQDDRNAMLEVLGYSSMEEMLHDVLPDSIRLDALSLPPALSEREVLGRLREIANRNRVTKSMIGLGYHGTITPPVIVRNLLENPGWYTSYTPYQAEISQGRLEALLNYQTVVTDLTGLPITNASLLDEATAAAEAMTMMRRHSKAESKVLFVDEALHPQTKAVIATRARPLDIEVAEGDPSHEVPACFGVVLAQFPSEGGIRDLAPLVEAARTQGALVTVVTDLLGLTVVVPPGEVGADIAVGSAQRFGVPMGFGGPHAGFMAATPEFTRTLPGRIVGISVDTGGRPAYRLALQTREQHIRRERATSNICTSQVLLAVIAGMYAVYHGPAGLADIARHSHRLACDFAASVSAAGHALGSTAWFDTISVEVPGHADRLVEEADRAGYSIRRLNADWVSVTFDETTTDEDLIGILTVFGAEPHAGSIGIPEPLQRTSDYLTHPVFHSYRSETELLRYLRRLMDRDIALDRSMIPLGSCTMKLNATAEMMAITWPEFANLHPFAPLSHAAGYLELIAELEQWLAEITGYDAVSLQPNAGSQGEYAGLLAIRAYHESRGDAGRRLCLIPSSAHGTNPASAAMAGFEVMVVECDDEGNVDIEDLRLKLKEHGPEVGALMVTYPSTHGVFETDIVEICELIHEAGGQVYLDGANLNAMVGVSKPGVFGSDVSHLNLHKTFTIPHGGGGPGVGPIGVRSHLAPFLPNHPMVDAAGPASGPGPVSAAPWGSAGILPISWAYIALMGSDGLRHATEAAILNANYVAHKLQDHYPILYRGAMGRIAHECILDIRPLHRASGVTVEDIAKRLIDYGFHAPTISFPVAGTLMIEPTESESLYELDRFVEAMISIREEIAAIEDGAEYEASALYHSPHTAEDLLGVEWDRPYSREEAAYPVDAVRTAKYWPPVSRIDARYGDRHLVCACVPVDDYR